MKCGILSIGNELIEGYVQNTNATYFSRKLNESGFDVTKQLTVLDDEKDIINAINDLSQNNDLIIVSGGLGPTEDDLTKTSIAKALDIPLKINENELNKLKEYFSKRKIEYSNTNDKQALFSDIDTLLINNNGTANGYYFTKNNTTYCILPGPPTENMPLFDEFLNTLVKDETFELDLFLFEIGESTADAMISDIYNKYKDVYIGMYIQDYGIDVRIRSTNKEEILACFEELKYIYKDFYLMDNHNPVEEFVKELVKQQITISFAESCTAGLATAMIGDIPGVSAVLNESHITYANTAKMKYLNVLDSTLKQYGAVSKECAKEMANGLFTLTDSKLCISITGIAGPDGGTIEKPVGTVFFNIKYNNINYPFHKVFRGNRQQVRTRAALYIICQAYRIITNG